MLQKWNCKNSIYKINLDRLEVTCSYPDGLIPFRKFIVSNLNSQNFETFVVKNYETVKSVYKYVYQIDLINEDGKENDVFGWIFWGSNQQTRQNIYINVANSMLYNDKMLNALFDVMNRLNLGFLWYSRVDIALDSTDNLGQILFDVFAHGSFTDFTGKEKEYNVVINNRKRKWTDRNNKDLKIMCPNPSRENPFEEIQFLIKNSYGGELKTYDKAKEVKEQSKYKKYTLFSGSDKCFRLELSFVGLKAVREIFGELKFDAIRNDNLKTLFDKAFKRFFYISYTGKNRKTIQENPFEFYDSVYKNFGKLKK